jgi:hypothetical protein
LPDFDAKSQGLYVQPWEIPLVVWRLRDQLPKLRRLDLNHLPVRYTVVLNAGEGISGRLVIILTCTRNVCWPFCLDWTLPEGFDTSIMVEFLDLVKSKVNRTRPPLISFRDFNERLLRSIPHPIAGVTVDNKISPNNLGDILLDPSLIQLRSDFVLSLSASSLWEKSRFRDHWTAWMDRHGAKVRSLVISSLNDIRLRPDGLTAIVRFVLTFMPRLRSLSITLDVDDVDEIGCLPYLSSNIGEVPLDVLSLHVVNRPQRPLFNIVRLLARMLHKDGTLVYGCCDKLRR